MIISLRVQQINNTKENLVENSDLTI